MVVAARGAPSVLCCWPAVTGASGVLVISASTDSILSNATPVAARKQLYEPAESARRAYTLCPA